MCSNNNEKLSLQREDNESISLNIGTDEVDITLKQGNLDQNESTFLPRCDSPEISFGNTVNEWPMVSTLLVETRSTMASSTQPDPSPLSDIPTTAYQSCALFSPLLNVSNITKTLVLLNYNAMILKKQGHQSTNPNELLPSFIMHPPLPSVDNLQRLMKKPTETEKWEAAVENSRTNELYSNQKLCCLNVSTGLRKVPISLINPDGDKMMPQVVYCPQGYNVLLRNWKASLGIKSSTSTEEKNIEFMVYASQIRRERQRQLKMGWIKVVQKYKVEAAAREERKRKRILARTKIGNE
ncbi:hypothetical protein CRE_06512 [Caenorhabditis remanei]|uniref:Uncharacterized protein n=1 Tax=Caenorhabditis remanei TaxID=31234 RepID=E3M1B2_CAERE|nr:hypothetical protein CRE_06512 [Caenorhabditis remanei]